MAIYATAPLLGLNLQSVYTPPSASTTLTPYQSGDQPPIVIGTRVNTNGNGEAVYVLAGGTINQYDWVGIDGAGSATALTATTIATKPTIGVAQVAIASGSYGWVQTKGGNSADAAVRGNVKTAGKDVPLYATATAGYVDDAVFSSIATGVIQGAKAIISMDSSVGTSTTVMLQWPMSAPGSAT